jgi:short-subunit dehydrogenase
MPRKVLLAGANSAIAQETAKLLAGDGDALFLVGRDADKLRIVAEDLAVRAGHGVGRLVADLDDIARHAQIVEQAARELGGLDTVIVAHGVLGDQRACERDFAEAERVVRTNFLSAASLLTLAANRFEQQAAGTIVAIGSVAGDRGRQSNYVYGAAKGALALFLQGLRNRLAAHGVTVITVKPGFVATPMTAHLERGLLFASPATVARGIHRAMRGRKDVVYLPWFWRPILLVIRCIPEGLFKRLKL